MTATDTTLAVTYPAPTQVLITRDFAAPADMVYRAWTTPELIKRWWNAKRGTVTSAEVDLRVGGRWRYAMTAHGGLEVAFHGEYLEIVPGERIVCTEVYEGAPDATAVNTVTFTPAGGGTRLTILIEHTSQENRDMHVRSGMEDGLRDALDLLAEVAAVS
jgi:uncharacterized protein YndB with AHSA1/START domain